MRLVIVTGMSGAGKTNALKMLEDMGFYCVDNLPIPLVEKFAELTLSNQGGIRNAALGIDIRSGDELSALDRIFDEWSRKRVPYEILFLDASSETLIKRYKESRRAHPLAGEGRIDSGIEKERLKLAFLKEEADYIIDTSKLLTKELKAELEKIFMANESYKNLYITILSFGFKYGIPSDADLVFDVRFLPNPYYVDELRPKTGEDQEVRDYVMQNGTADIFLYKLYDMLEFLIPGYVLEGKNQLVIAIGCTGGKHRSVTIAKAVYERLKSHEEFGLKIEHRDIDKDNKRKKE
ncbi:MULTISPECIES: RNase adapter RapZ [Hungatella]|uniref:RNase adapter RapZ n=1 Tax=Hungatella TaxID=1649459 RepID=UPI0011DD105E|nr:RNase adapter RapZ [Hungatella hathewayi]MCQ5385984.1 RNase adapter RapZ [Hungatella hathewayi]